MQSKPKATPFPKTDFKGAVSENNNNNNDDDSKNGSSDDRH